MSRSKPSSLEVARTFHLLQPLGAGGMGQVYEAVEPRLGQRLAVKVLRSELAAEAEARERFETEAEIMASIDHPGNLPVYGLGIDGEGRPFYAMKKVAGRTLEELLAERGERATDLTWLHRLLDLFEEACATVACAHEAGVVHRDLKPENILVDEQYGAVVRDRLGHRQEGRRAGIGQRDQSHLRWRGDGHPRIPVARAGTRRLGHRWTTGRRLRPRRDPLPDPDR